MLAGIPFGCRDAGSISSHSSNNKRIKSVTTKTFAQEVEEATMLVAVDFWAAWCGSCKMIAPTLDALAQEYEGRVKFVKVDVDNNQDLATRFNIRALPTLYLFKKGKSLDLYEGVGRKKEYQDWINKHL
ncbi:MAG: thioredoxin [Kiritimatiellae bacterium]|nr:thioredoxin [Kiritimatiellia bacterium]